MTPVFQTIIDPVKGNCMQAAYASILDLPLDEVPNFVAEPDTSEGNSDTRVLDWLAKQGLSKLRFDFYQKDRGPIILSSVMHAIEFSNVEHFLLSVPSQKFEKGSHIVVGQMSKEEYKMEVAHDPNPNNEKYDLNKTPPTSAIIITKLL